MPARARVMPRAHGQQRKPAELPEARDVVLPELLAGCASAPVEWTRLFHRAFFDVADLAIRARGLLVLQDVVIGRPSPLVKEIQLWGLTVGSDDLVHMSATDIATSSPQRMDSVDLPALNMPSKLWTRLDELVVERGKRARLNQRVEAGVQSTR